MKLRVAWWLRTKSDSHLIALVEMGLSALLAVFWQVRTWWHARYLAALFTGADVSHFHLKAATRACNRRVGVTHGGAHDTTAPA